MASGGKNHEAILIQGAGGDPFRDRAADRTNAGRKKSLSGELRTVVDHRNLEADPSRFYCDGMTDVSAAGNHQKRTGHDRLDKSSSPPAKCSTRRRRSRPAAFQARSKPIDAWKRPRVVERCVRQPLHVNLDLGKRSHPGEQAAAAAVLQRNRRLGKAFAMASNLWDRRARAHASAADRQFDGRIAIAHIEVEEAGVVASGRPLRPLAGPRPRTGRRPPCPRFAPTPRRWPLPRPAAASSLGWRRRAPPPDVRRRRRTRRGL